jgi:O-antigen ligase
MVLHALLGLSAVAIAWGALAFGAVYPWAYAPLAIACGVVGIGALVLERRGRPTLRPLAASLGAVAVAIGLQMVPLPPALLAQVSPGTDGFLRQYDLSYVVAQAGTAGTESAPADAPLPRHPLSIAPDRTALGAMLFVAFALFFLGTSRLISVVGARSVTRWLIPFGAGLAIVGIAQRGLTAGDIRPLIYGFWRPEFESTPFGPFVNPNHFAGWMLMALPLAMAAFIDALLPMIEAASAHRRTRIAELDSPRFAAVLLWGAASLIMGLSLLMTRSRSALLAFVVGIVMAAWIVFRRQSSAATRTAVAASALLVLLGTAAWGGVDTIASKFTEAQGPKSLAARVKAWKDTGRIIRDFPLTGSGLNTYGRAMIVYQSENRYVHFQEAHNDYLQLAAEGGLLVGIPVLITLIVFTREVRRRFREAPTIGTTFCLRVGAVVGLVSIALQSLVEFSLQMPGNAALFAVLAAIALHQSPNLPPTSRCLPIPIGDRPRHRVNGPRAHTLASITHR